jgi:RNA processing factor Prp31
MDNKLSGITDMRALAAKVRNELAKARFTNNPAETDRIVRAQISALDDLDRSFGLLITIEQIDAGGEKRRVA